MTRFTATSLAPILALSLGLGLAACGDNSTDDVVQIPAPGAEAAPVTQARADTATTQTAVALGMTSAQLEDADLLSAQRTKLGEVERLVLDANNTVTHLVIDVEGPADDVLIPLSQVTSITIDGDTDLQTALTAAEVAALPRYDPNAAPR
jgi:hypothetical protein